jgi:predicted enzyme related to lactoylglutathione lyase
MTERVLGLGGIFLTARDPARLAAWYDAALGVTAQDYGGTFVAQFSSAADPGSDAAWSLFPHGTTYFPGPVMVNYRVRDLAAMLSQLRAIGADVDERVEDSDFGRFGWVTDPEGNRIELWQPAAPAAAAP